MGQLSLLVSDATGNQGEEIELDLKLIGFEAVASMQFSVNWDSTVLDLKTVEDLNGELPDFTDDQIGLAETNAGVIRVAWYDNTLRGVSLPDSAQLFKMKFTVIGEPGVKSVVTISDSPITIEFTNTESRVMDIEEIIEGEINILDNTTALIYLEAENGMQLHQNTPNPFRIQTHIPILLPKPQPIHFFVTDISGKVIYRDYLNPIERKFRLSIKRAVLNAPGIYYYTLQSGDYQLTKQMILLQ